MILDAARMTRREKMILDAARMTRRERGCHSSECWNLFI